ncbi:uncharacterized protein LOC129308917 [Prosopis cineraria]|uniref:uncharacterized protein LOC129308917 n=1 Tax=Prosopis cineraria TaxID=364024 RepID=UPI0024100C63|nr:uncharacterized protein LOC129308917 [Prosopis cineraria]
MTCKSIKGSIIADYLAANPIEEYQPINFQFPGEKVLMAEEEEQGEEKWKMYFDGVVNIYGSGLVVLVSLEGRQFPLAIKLGFDCTNNMAEYEVCLNGLQATVTLGIKELDVFEDSALVIYQATGEWQTKDSKLIPYQKYLTQLINKFDKVRFHHLSRDKNQFVDALAILAVMVKLDCGIHVQPIRIEAKINLAYCLNVENEMKAHPWFHDIKSYIKKQRIPFGSNGK